MCKKLNPLASYTLLEKNVTEVYVPVTPHTHRFPDNDNLLGLTHLNYSGITKLQITFGLRKCLFKGEGTRCRDQAVGKIIGGREKCRTSRSSIRKCLDHMTSKPSTQTLMFPERASPLCASEDVKMDTLGTSLTGSKEEGPNPGQR
jgi:hypothetical protein